MPIHFIRIDVEKCPFFVKKLQIRIIPTLLLFDNGIVCDRLDGLDTVAYGNNYTLRQLELRLSKFLRYIDNGEIRVGCIDSDTGSSDSESGDER